MNRNTLRARLGDLKNRANGVVASVHAKAAATGTALMVAAGSAAATTPPAFDSSTIITAIQDNTATALLIIGAFILGVWTLRSMGLLKRG